MRLPALNMSKLQRRGVCARLCQLAGGELAPLQFLLGLAPVQTTERDPVCKPRLSQAENGKFGPEDAAGDGPQFGFWPRITFGRPVTR